MSDESTQPAIVPTRQQAVDFYGDQVLAAQVADGTIWVPLNPLCAVLGVAWAAQRVRVNRDPILSQELRTIMTITPGGPQEMVALPLKLLPGFLFGLQASRVKPELRAKILHYQRDCYEVLWTAFKGEILPTVPPPSGASGAALALEIAEAITALARQQLALEGRLEGVESRVGTMADYLRGYIVRSEQRFDALELRLSEGATISEAEAAEVALNVKAVAHVLEERGAANGYQRVYSELYRRYRVSSYKNLPRARYQEVLAWLAGWAQELEGQGRDDGPAGG
jgi:hypothetical protein